VYVKREAPSVGGPLKRSERDEAMAEARIKDPSVPASYKQRLGIRMAMVATAFPYGLNKDEAAVFLDRLFSEEEGYREQAVADLTGLIRSNLSKQVEEKAS
jgi:hypothetical protein